MRRLAAVALMVAWLTMPACAQRGTAHGGSAGHGGSGGHGGQGFHGGGGGSRPSSPSPGFSGSRAPSPARGFRSASPRSPIARQGYPGPNRYPDRDRHRRPYVSPYRTGIPYMVAPWPGWAAPEYLGYGDDTGYGDTSAAQGDENGAYDAQNQEPDQPEFRQPYQPASAPASESAVTLIYKDGRPREQIHNYILTRTKLFVQDEPH